MKKQISLLFAAALALASAPARAVDNLTMADFGHSIKLSVEGYTGTETLENFPVLVRISESGIPGFDYDDTSAWNKAHDTTYGYDVAFFAEDGTRLASENDTWVHNGTSLVWVRIPQMTQGFKFFMCYNVADGVMVENPNPWGDYVGVWHLKEPGGTSKAVIKNSTTNGLLGMTSAKGAPAVVNDGKIGASRRIATDTGNNPGYDSGITVALTNSADLAAVNGLAPQFTASFWYCPEGNASNWEYLMSRKSTDDYSAWGIQFGDERTAVWGQIRIYGGNGKNYATDAGTYGTANSKGITIPDGGDGVWRKMDCVWTSDAKYILYQDGVLVAAGALSGNKVAANGSLNLSIGGALAPASGKGGRGFKGIMDEARLRPGVVSADWVKADYDTVVNESFVVVAPPEVTWANGAGETPGVEMPGKDTVVFAGTVIDCANAATCEIQYKVWPTGGTAPSEWTTLTNGLVATDSFSAIASGLSAATSYDYELRALGNDGSSTAPVSGTFTTLAGFAVAWSSATTATGLSEIRHDRVVVAGTVATMGEATACEIQGKFWAADETEPTDWTTLTNGLGAAEAFSVVLANLSPLTTYNYLLRAVGDDEETTTPVTGTFTTEQGLTVAWTDSTGLAQVGYDFVKIGGSVAAPGGATSCGIQAKIWLSGDPEPTQWTTIAEGLALDAGFNATIRETAAGAAIAPGTTYAYALRAVGNDGEETAPVPGTFTTGGEQGEQIGSTYTKFFDDGTNAVWVADGFERYLPFTVTGYTGTETLTNFPVLVEVRAKDTNGFSYADFYHYDGADMAFVDETGHIIPHEIDTWNKNGMSLIWVRLPKMNNGTTFTMCYRSPLIDPLPDVGNTFEKYVGVWHMNETQNGVAHLKDSTVNNLPGESHAKSEADSNGRIGYARRVAKETGTSSSNGRIMVYDHDDILRTGVGNVFTFSGWYKTADAKPNWAYLVARKGDDYSKGWGIQYTDDNAKDKLRVWSDPLGSKMAHADNNPGGYYHFDITTYSTGASVGYNHGDWAYWTFVFSNCTFHAYHNGTELASTAGGFTLEQPFANDETADFDFLVIGGMEFGTGAFNGWVDEARYSKGPRSDDWIKAEYDSTLQAVNWQDANKRFVTKGTVSRGNDSPVPVVVWDQGANLPLSIIDVSYAYVQFAGTVTFCGVGANTCRVEYQLWADGEEDPTVDGAWTTLGTLTNVTAGTSFSVPVTGLKQDMPYNFRIRAVNAIDGAVEQANREQSGSFRTNGNISGSGGGELMRIDNRFVHRFRAGSYTFTTPDYVTSVEILVVGGGGAGGYKVGGGGGGGGLFYSESFPVEANTTYRIQVGEGGNASSDLASRGQNGQLSYFARKDGDDEVDETVLISVPGGGAGGNYVKNDAVVAPGADGGSGGGGTYAFAGGRPVSNEVDGVWVAYGYEGGQGNATRDGGNKDGPTAAGGGGGAAREGVTASFDSWYGGGAGGAGLANSMTGERLFYGAGGGGGYIYKFDDKGNYTKPGAGGSGIGGNAADVRNGTLATSGVENTGAGGGGGSMTRNAGSAESYWQGGDGGDGVVLIAYEVHGRDPISEEPRITMVRCDYDPDAGTNGTGVASIDYRAFWAGIQAQTNDIYVLYSTVGEEDILAGNGERAKVAEGAIGIGSTTFVPPEVGYTYWVRLMARKDATSFMYSDEVATFYVPVVTLNGAAWNKNDASANVTYKLHDLSPETHLFCYVSESREQLEGDDPPTGDGVHYLDLGTGRASATQFTIPATEGLDKTKVYYVRLGSGDAGGWKHFLSDAIVELKDAPSVILTAAAWDSQIATVDFTINTVVLDPADTELVAYYSTVENDVKNNTLAKVTQVNLGSCEALPNAVASSASFPLHSDAATTYYVRLALHSVSSNAWFRSQNYKSVSVSAATADTLYVYATANPKKGAYGDAPQSLDYEVSYGGATNDVAMAHKPAIGGAPACIVSSEEPSGIYDITQGSLGLEGGGAPYTDTDTGTTYQYAFVFVGAKYTVTNAVFEVAFPDVVTNYTGEAINTGDIEPVVSGIRNNQEVAFQYRVGSGEWSSTIGSTYADTWSHTVQFKATAPNHDEATGTFMITINPAPLLAEISATSWDYTGVPAQPAATTNVTGHVKPELNPLTCEFREEAGDWQAELPTFVQPGVYKLFLRVSAPNHATFTTNCTFEIRGWDYQVNLDGQTGYPTPIRVTDPGWFLRNTAYTSEDFTNALSRYEKLDEVQENGLKLWHNYVIERGDLTKKLVAAILQSGSRVDENSFVVRFPNVEALRNTGLDVKFRLDRKLKGESEFTEGALSDKYEMNVPLGPEDPTGLYVFNMVLTPTNPVAYPGEAVLASCATVGVLRVSSLATNTVTAAPWMAMSKDEAKNEAVTVAEAVNPNGLTAGSASKDEAAANDQILVYDAPTDTFRTWAYESGTTWRSITTVTKAGLSATDADTNHLARGSAFWLVRQAPSQYFYLVGRYTGDSYTNALAGGTADAPGFTLVANPTMDDVGLNDIAFVGGSPADTDRIVVQDVSGIDKIYVRKNNQWGRYVTKRVGGRIKQTWETGGTIPSGTGFWYVRTADTPLTVRFGGAAQ